MQAAPMMFKPSTSPQKSQQRPTIPFLLSQSNKHVEPTEPHAVVLFLQPPMPQMGAVPALSLHTTGQSQLQESLWTDTLQLRAAQSHVSSSSFAEGCFVLYGVPGDLQGGDGKLPLFPPQLESLHTRINTYGMWAYFQARKTSTHGVV